MAYVKSRLKEYSRDFAYKTYISDALRVIANNVATSVGGGEYARIGQRYADIISTKKANETVEDNRPVIEVVHDMWEKVKKGGK